MTNGVNMCKNHNHGYDRRISEIHSTLVREFGLSDNCAAVEDDFNTLSRRADYLKNPNDKNTLIALGDALSFQMRYNEALKYYRKAVELYPDDYCAHRKCAIRYMSVLNIDAARREFEWCDIRTDDKLDIKYRLALCAYYDGNYKEARKILIDCYPLAENNGEMYIAVLYWHLQCLVRLGMNISEALKYFYADLDGGHHIGYMQTVRLFLTDDIRAGDIIDRNDELNSSIYLYGLYAYHLRNGRLDEAFRTFDKMLGLDTYFSSFAYIGAYCEKRAYETAKQKLYKYFEKNKKIAIAFSGGTDSALLLAVAKRSGADVRAYCVKSQFQPSFEIDDADKLARQLDVKCEVINLNVLSYEDITANGGNRCYYCKSKILGAVKECAASDGYGLIADGTNVTDGNFERPGMRAVTEFGIVSPLAECGLKKSDVRRLSYELGLFTCGKSSYSCIATRVAENERITAEILSKIEKSENFLFSQGYQNFRVRFSLGNAIIEISRAQEQKFRQEKQNIFKELSQYFDNVVQSDVLR